MGDRNTEPVGTVQQLQTDHDRDRAALLVPASADGKTASGYQLSCAKYTRALHNPGDLVELARVVETGDSFLQAGVSGKLCFFHHPHPPSSPLQYTYCPRGGVSRRDTRLGVRTSY